MNDSLPSAEGTPFARAMRQPSVAVRVLAALLAVAVLRECSAQTTIASAYSSAPDTCVFTTPNSYGVSSNLRLGQVTYVGGTGNKLQLAIRPSYNFTGALDVNFNFTQGQVFVPDEYTFTMPYCTPNSPQILVNLTTTGCVGELYYGYYDITNLPPGGVAIPVDTSINGAAGAEIEGLFISRVDELEAYRGTITWLRPSTCAANNSAFLYTLEFSNLLDVGDSGVVAYKDSASSEYKYCRTYGFACSTLPRQTTNNPNIAPFNPRPVLVPICKQYMPFSTNFSIPSYEAVFGTGFRAPTDVPLNAIVYQLRADNLETPIAVYAEVEFRYVTGSVVNTTVSSGPLAAKFEPILFLVSAGTYPALVYTRFYNPSQAFELTYNEVNYGFLPPCNCGTGNNVLCDSTNYTLTRSAFRSQIPNYNQAIVYTDAPTCVFFVNANNNGTAPLAGVPFVIQSASTGGVGTTFYQWQLVNLPVSAGSIDSGQGTADITVTIAAPSTVTVKLVVWNANNVTRDCSQTFTVIAPAPTAVIAPAGEVTIATNVFLTLDGTGSYTPIGFIESYTWVQSFGPAPATYSSTTMPIITFLATVPGVYIVNLNVRAVNTNDDEVLRILVVEPPPVAPPSGAPVAPPFSPGCVNPGNNFGNVTLPPSGSFSGSPVAPLPPGTGAPLAPVAPPANAPTNVDPAVINFITGIGYIGALLIFSVFAIFTFAQIVRALQLRAAPSLNGALKTR